MNTKFVQWNNGTGNTDDSTIPHNYYYGDYFYSPMYQYGWICPKCGRAINPSYSYCPMCNPVQYNLPVVTCKITLS